MTYFAITTTLTTLALLHLWRAERRAHQHTRERAARVLRRMEEDTHVHSTD